MISNFNRAITIEFLIDKYVNCYECGFKYIVQFQKYVQALFYFTTVFQENLMIF